MILQNKFVFNHVLNNFSLKDYIKKDYKDYVRLECYNLLAKLIKHEEM